LLKEWLENSFLTAWAQSVRSIFYTTLKACAALTALHGRFLTESFLCDFLFFCRQKKEAKKPARQTMFFIQLFMRFSRSS